MGALSEELWGRVKTRVAKWRLVYDQVYNWLQLQDIFLHLAAFAMTNNVRSRIVFDAKRAGLAWGEKKRRAFN
jgi:hypothetical protein